MNKVEYDMLQGNINRICVTDDLSELFKMAQYAHKRIDNLVKDTGKRILEKEKAEKQ